MLKLILRNILPSLFSVTSVSATYLSAVDKAAMTECKPKINYILQ